MGSRELGDVGTRRDALEELEAVHGGVAYVGAGARVVCYRV